MASPKINWPDGLRPSEAPVYTYNELTIPAQPAVVWAWLIRAAWWPQWYGNCHDVRFVAGDGPDLGPDTHFTWKTFGLRVETVVKTFSPHEQLAWYGTGLLGAYGYHAWVIEPTADGCHVITEETQSGLIPSLGRLYLRRELLREHQNWLEGLAQMARQGLPDDR